MDAIERVTERAKAITERRVARHRVDVVYVQAHHPELASWLTDMMGAFGKTQVRYRVTLKRMSATAWHYSLPNGTRGTLVGEGLEQRSDAIAEIARTHEVDQEEVRVRRASEDETS